MTCHIYVTIILVLLMKVLVLPKEKKVHNCASVVSVHLGDKIKYKDHSISIFDFIGVKRVQTKALEQHWTEVC